ncbi:V073; CPXV-BR_074 V073 [Cowpox virus]|uniref:CPXV073 protein n=1 Tax=Cowpox virus TaxID=10243 RepID=G0XX05_COWPX|nr:soluble myristylprotein [Cowpox virus]ATB55113.1 CPXV073 protein [Cowpox virus]ATB55335.1 CPXV073 protein [Cowpox virus]ATB55550.1 CPXV073 protein [Cowpox virus]ATB55764.1 CPXV073 protein [Cowpox virus]
MGTAATIQTPTKLMNKENAEMILEKIVDHIVMYISDESRDENNPEYIDFRNRYGDYRYLIIKSDHDFVKLCKNHAEKSSPETQQMIIKHIYEQYLIPVSEVLLKPMMSMGDIITYNGCKDNEWMLEQLSTLNFNNLHVWNSCSIGNVTRIFYTFFSYLMKDKLDI